jgi:murein DD-endopeptidase MepM/ murein hydrolase activator NlpD
MSRYDSRRDLRAPHRRPVRAETVVIRRPPPLLPHISLEDTLAAVGIRANRARGATHSHGLLWRWFAYESTALVVGNAVAGALLFVVAMTMTAPGMRLAASLGIAAFIYDVLNDILPWLALALFAAALLKAAHAWLDTKAHVATRILGYALATLLAVAGLWIETMLGFASVVPWMFKPVLALAGGQVVARIATTNAYLVSYFEPVLVGGTGLLLLAKHFKSGMTRRAPLTRKRIALGGIALAGAVAAVAAHAGWRHYTGDDRRDGFAFAIGGETLSGKDRVYGPLFAPGVPCHVSSLYGWRDDPLEPGRNEKHQGIDVAVKEGTPVHAMTDGRVMFAEFDGGLGNFVALRAAGDGAPSVVNGHMSRLAVRAGDLVHRGDVIGYAGSTGRSTGPHVHVQLCPGGHMAHGAFVCGGATNPYENWPTLAALTHMSCVSGPEIY